ncbi:hypothetical protein NA57DRAFT_61706 [Rhizodiscina lignyota]|uniref:F-box domain-containing protein n=1 Tax=Rhizodiscina lignyota TaxID=1504668 RepID=A0A9P4I1D9_9PEZI|nr:hypothetical protein NA57DRAFT_61706 [Rhizodiscina lignyota]
MGDLQVPSSDSSSSPSSTQLGSTAATTPVRVASLPVVLSSLALPPKQHANPTFSSLPDELVDQIFSYVEAPPHDDGTPSLKSQPDFWSLCLVNKQCQRAATPYLYACFEHELYKDPQHLHLFLRNIIHDAKLASYVQYISLKDQESCGLFQNMRMWREWASTFYRPALADEDRQLFLEAARDLQLQRVDALDTIAEKEEAQAALLLSRTTDVTQLRMTIPNLGKNRLLLEILKETTDRGTALQKLSKFTGIYYNFDGDIDGGFELKPISSLFRLPAIQRINGVACLEPEDDAFKGFDCPEGTSTVREIDFRRSSVCPKAMSLMVGACRALRSFYCDWGGHTVGWSEINFPTVGAALRKQEKSLESLTLDVRKHYDVWPENEDVLIPPLGSFVGFERLRYIEAPAAALIGWDEGHVDGFPLLHEILPFSIEKLVINQWSPGIIEHLEKMAELCAAMFPLLKEMALHSAPHDADERKMQELYDKNGAEVRIRFKDGEEVDHFA